MTGPTPEQPLYRVVRTAGRATNFHMIICDEGERLHTVVCAGMDKWAAEWLVEQIQGKPYAPGVPRVDDVYDGGWRGL